LSLEPAVILSLAAVGPFAVNERMATVELGTCCYFSLAVARPFLLLLSE